METNYALIKDSIVINIIVLDDPDAKTLEHFKELHGADLIVLSQDDPRASVGGIYDEVGFIDIKPYDSWVLDGWDWKPPIAYPTDGNIYVWNEDTVSWLLIEERLPE